MQQPAAPAGACKLSCRTIENGENDTPPLASKIYMTHLALLALETKRFPHCRFSLKLRKKITLAQGHGCRDECIIEGGFSLSEKRRHFSTSTLEITPRSFKLRKAAIKLLKYCYIFAKLIIS
jgi:hypothetical protein